MKTKLILGLGLVATTMLASAANAEEKSWPNWYIGLHGGVGFYPDSDVTTTGASAELESDAGYVLGASLGYSPASDIPFYNMTRWELEYSYRANDGDSIGGLPVSSTETLVNSLMANWLLDFKNDTYFTPYAGGGIGFANVELETAGGGVDDSVFAWQLMAGIGYEPESMPHTVWGLGYRYFTTDDVDISSGGTTSELEYSNHSIEGNVRFRF